MSDIDIKNSTADASIETSTAKEISLTSEKTPVTNKSQLIEEVREAKETFKESPPEATAQKPDGQALTQEPNDLSQKATQSTLSEMSPSTEAAVELASNIEENMLTTPEKLIKQPQTLSAEIEELLSVIRSGDLIDIIQFMRTHDIERLQAAYEGMGGIPLADRIKQADPEFDDGCIRTFLKQELLETVAHLLARSMMNSTLSSDLISQLGDVLSDPDLQELIHVYGVMFVTNLNMDILQSLPEIDRFEAAPFVSTLFKSEKEVAQYLKKEAEQRFQSDPITNTINAASIALQEAVKKLEEALQEALKPDAQDPSSMSASLNASIRDTSQQLRLQAERKREKAISRRFFHTIVAALLGFLLAVLGEANLSFKILIPCLFGCIGWMTSHVPPVQNRRKKRSKRTAASVLAAKKN